MTTQTARVIPIGTDGAKDQNSDFDLVEAAVDGDSYAFRLLAERHAGDVFGYASRYLQRPADAEDVCQQTFLNAYRSLGKYDPAKGSLRNWLFRIAANLALNVVRSQKRRREIGDQSALEQRQAESPQPGPERNLLGLELRRAVFSLPEIERQTLLLFYYQGLRQPEISEVLGIPVGTVKSRLNRAIQRLRCQIGRQGSGV